MKRLYIRCMAMMLALFATNMANATDLTDKLETLTAVSKVKELQSADGLEKLVFFVNQQLDWNDASEGTFGHHYQAPWL